MTQEKDLCSSSIVRFLTPQNIQQGASQRVIKGI